MRKEETKKGDISTFGERHLKQITAVCNQEAEITQPLGRHSNQKADQSSRLRARKRQAGTDERAETR